MIEYKRLLGREVTVMKKYYIMLITSMVVWGIDPVVTTYLYNYYSASVFASVCTFFSMILFFVLSAKNLKNINGKFLKVAIPMATMSVLANMLQRIGLQYTTPACYAFLERLSCAVVPVVFFLMTRKKPTANQILASVLCLVGCFILSGVKLNDLASIGIGNILCGLAGILAGVYVVFLSVYGRDLNLMLYMVVYMTVYFLESALMAVVLNFVKIGGVPMESMVFSMNPLILSLSAIFGLISVGICWLLRTEAGTHLNPVKVSLLLPLSTIISGVVSVICGYDKLTVSYVVGAVLIILSIVIMEMRRPQKLK